mgnify:CR=1 FL=1
MVNETDKKIIHPQIEAMKNLDIGARVEIILKRGAVWCDGLSPAPTVDPAGYILSNKDAYVDLVQDFPGIHAVGYIAEMDLKKVTLVPTVIKRPFLE